MRLRSGPTAHALGRRSLLVAASEGRLLVGNDERPDSQGARPLGAATPAFASATDEGRTIRASLF
jgi:hypothetical protein